MQQLKCTDQFRTKSPSACGVSGYVGGAPALPYRPALWTTAAFGLRDFFSDFVTATVQTRDAAHAVPAPPLKQ